MPSQTRPASSTAGNHSQVSDSTYSAATEFLDWENLGNVGALDGVLSRSGNTRFQQYRTKRLDVKGFDFSIPAGATIDGIVAAVHWRVTTAASTRRMDELQVRLLKAGSPGGTNKAFASSISDVVAATTHGSSSDLWGSAWDATDINASNFGIALQYFGGSAAINSAQVDFVEITVHYTEASAVPDLEALARTNVLRPRYTWTP